MEKWLQVLSAADLAQLAQPWQAQLSRLLPHAFPAASNAPEQQEHLFRAVAELLCLSGELRILLLEDLQWADEASLQLFLFMAQFIQSSQSPVLLLGTLRSEEAADNPALHLHPNNLSSTLAIRSLTAHPLQVQAT